MQIPQISFGIPTYNRPNRLRRLLDTIYNQKDVELSDFEVIVSDNSTNNETEQMLSEHYGDKPNLIYHKNNENIGSERNIRQVFDLGTGNFTWLMPDDDFLSTNQSLITVINNIKLFDTRGNLTFAITNLRSEHIDLDIIYSEKLNPINNEIYFEDGKDILNLLSDADLLGAQRLIVKKGVLDHPFEQRHTKTGFVGCMSIALVAASKGAALYISNPVVTFCAGDDSAWRTKVPKIYYFDMSFLLLEAVNDLGYSKTRIDQIIEQKKIFLLPMFNPLFFLFQMHDFKWSPFIKLYGFKFFLWNLLLSPLNIILNTRLAKKLFGRKIIL
jgi:glycosyltransferase involved in cell wall biosynthesis